MNSNRIEKKRQEQSKVKAVPQMEVTMQNLHCHSMRERQTALHLTQLANQGKDNGLNGSTIQALLLQLTVRPLPRIPHSRCFDLRR